MLSLAQQRCFNHATREAAARCPACKRFFCRECVTEHAGRMLCAPCLAAAAQSPQERARARLVVGLLRPLQMVASVFLLWLLFYALGQALVSLPDTFHQKDLTQTTVWNDNE